MKGEIERGGGLGAQTEIKNGVSAEEVAATAGTGAQRGETKRGMEERKGAGGKTGIPTRTGYQRENGLGTGKTGRIKRIAGIKTVGSGTERRERPRGAEVEAEKRGTEMRKKRAENVSEVTVARESVIGMESRAHINAAAAKKGPIISASLVMITVNIVNAEGVRALIKSPSCFVFVFIPFSQPFQFAHQTSGNVLAHCIVALHFLHFLCP